MSTHWVYFNYILFLISCKKSSLPSTHIPIPRDARFFQMKRCITKAEKQLNANRLCNGPTRLGLKCLKGKAVHSPGPIHVNKASWNNNGHVYPAWHAHFLAEKSSVKAGGSLGFQLVHTAWLNCILHHQSSPISSAFWSLSYSPGLSKIEFLMLFLF